MDNYNRKQMMIPKTTRAAIMLWVVPLIDIFIVAICGFLGIVISQSYTTVQGVQIISLICGLIIGIGLIKRTQKAPNMRNWRVLFFVWLQDKSKYFPITVTNATEEELRTKEKEGGNSLFKSNRKEKRAAEAQLKTALSLGMPINCTEDGIITYPDGSAARYLQLGSTDLFNLPDSGLIEWQDSLTGVSRTYIEDCSYISMAARIDMSANQRYWRYLRQKCATSPQGKRRAWDLTEKIAAAEQVERRTDLYSSKKYYVELFGSSVKEVRERTSFYKMGAQKLKPRELSRAETIEVLFSINNPIND
ncbi:hypothetical protein JF75_05460 [Lactobacillus kimbladii]|uniref:Uncharacterized protein n=2 Tax=Lactobacillus kimbladii TaxID=1218506 RepID=A0A0F4LND5_9LACO|nr:hypothetical protein JF75_05460 [Lactobacillus kimbladii]